MSKFLTILVIIKILSCNSKLLAQNVYIPDSNFKAELVASSSINTNSDSEIQYSEAEAFTGAIVVQGKNIADLTGIEAFILLTNLYCPNNQITSLDVSANTNLNYLNCSYNQITSLDVSSNLALISLYCEYNQLSNLIVSSNPNLLQLQCYNNQFTNIDISSCLNLESLTCFYNQLTSLNVSVNVNLTYLNCSFNQITSLDVSSNLVLLSLYCTNNQLSSLDIKNGNNSNLNQFSCYSNPLLTCIQVDDALFMNANWVYSKDSIASYSEDCAIGINEPSKSVVSVYPNPTSGIISIFFNAKDKLVSYTVMKIDGVVVETGISTENTIKVNIQSKSNGIYFLKINTENYSEIYKIIKE